MYQSEVFQESELVKYSSLCFHCCSVALFVLQDNRRESEIILKIFKNFQMLCTALYPLTEMTLDKIQFLEAFVEDGSDDLQDKPDFYVTEGGDPYQEITFNAGYGMRTTLQSVVDAGLLSLQEVIFATNLQPKIKVYF